MSAIAEQVVRLTLPDGSVREVTAGTTGEAVAASIGARLAKDALAVKVDGQILDLKRPITASGAFEVITPKHPDALEVYRHSTAHLTAHAVKRLFPGVKIGIGPAIEHGFYYDFDPGRPFTPEDLEKIEAEMRKIVAENAADRARRDVEGRGRRALRGAGRPPEGGDRLRHPRGLALLLPAGRLRRPLPRAARPVDGEARRLQADARRRRLLEGRRDATRCSSGSTGPRSSPRRSWTSTSTGWSRRARATTASSARSSGSSSSTRGRPASPFFLPKGATLYNAPRRLHAGALPEVRLRGGRDPAGLRRRALQEVGALPELPREHVLHGGGRAGVRRQADELPGPLPDVLAAGLLVPRPAGPLRRLRAAPPLRALGRDRRG